MIGGDEWWWWWCCWIDDEGGQSAAPLASTWMCSFEPMLSQITILMMLLMLIVMLRMEMLSTWLHSLKVRSRSHRASGGLSNGLNVKTSDTFRFHIIFILCRLFQCSQGGNFLVAFSFYLLFIYGRLSYVLNAEASDTSRFHIIFILCRLSDVLNKVTSWLLMFVLESFLMFSTCKL